MIICYVLGHTEMCYDDLMCLAIMRCAMMMCDVLGPNEMYYDDL